MKKMLLSLLAVAAICAPIFAQNTPVDEFLPGVKFGMTMNELFETRLGVSFADGGKEGIGPFIEQMDGNPIVQASYSFYSLNNNFGLIGLSNISFQFFDDEAALATAREFAGSDFSNRSRHFWTLDDGSRIAMSLYRNQMQVVWMPIMGSPRK